MLSGIRTRNPHNQAPTDLGPKPHGHRDRYPTNWNLILLFHIGLNHRRILLVT